MPSLPRHFYCLLCCVACLSLLYLFIVNNVIEPSLVLGLSSSGYYDGVRSLPLGGVAPSHWEEW